MTESLTSSSLHIFCLDAPPRRVRPRAASDRPLASVSFARSRRPCWLFPRRLHSDGRDGASLSLSSLSRESVGLFRLMNLGVSGESGLASKQIRGKISVRRRRKDEKEGEKEGRKTEDCHLDKIYGRTIAAQKPFRHSPVPSRERGEDGGGRASDSEGGIN